jgi:hypothetical protein
MIISEAAFALVFLTIRFYLIRENRRRDQEQSDDRFDDAYVLVTDEKGSVVKEKVDKVSMHIDALHHCVSSIVAGFPRSYRWAKSRFPLRSMKVLLRWVCARQ